MVSHLIRHADGQLDLEVLFDIMLMNNFLALLKGGTICIAPADLLLNTPEVIVNDLRATGTFVVSSMAMLLRPERMPTLDAIFVGGEPLGKRVLDNFAQRPGDKKGSRRLVNGYGPTEATVFVTNHICHTSSRASVLGVPLPGTRIFVLDDAGLAADGRLSLAPLGVAGELAISSLQLSPGYLNRLKETSQAFIDDPEFGRLYKTGDRVRVVWTESGERKLDYLGRITSDQVKLNGRRVELPEIENVLSRIDCAARVVVIAADGRLIAFILPWTSNVESDEDAIVAQCREVAHEFLPTWMQPTRYVMVDSLPYSINGKVDRKALQSSLINAAESVGSSTTTRHTSHSASSNVTSEESSLTDHSSLSDSVKDAEIELSDDYIISAVRQAFIDALGNIEMEKYSRIADTGLDSLRALVLLQSLEEHKIAELEIRDILTAIDVNDLVELIKHRRAQGDGHPTPDLDKRIEESSTLSHEDTADDRSSTVVDGIDVSKIAADDADEIFELSAAAKLRHFDYHCRASALTALGFQDYQVEQVLPATNVQTRFLALAVDPDFYDRSRFIGRPYVEHFPYKLPIDIDSDRFQHAVEAVLPRYDCFRAVYTPVKHALAPFAQVTLHPSFRKIPNVVIICDDRGADNTDSHWQQIIKGAQLAAENTMGIDQLGITVSWVRSPDNRRCVFILSLFHATYDGTQLGYLFDAIMAEYEQPGCKPPLDLLPMRRGVELNLSYDWVSTVVFWAGRLGGVAGCRLGAQQPIPKTLLSSPYAGGNMTHMRSLKVEASISMRELSQAAMSMHQTMLAVVEAAWASVLAQTLSRRSDEEAIDVQFGTVLNGRQH